MNLVADIGNTLWKFALLEEGRLVAQCTLSGFDPEALGAFLDRHPVRAAILSSTRGEVAGAEAWLRRRIGRVMRFTASTPVPIRNGYLTPETLGRDRLAAAVGAATLFPGRPALVVDFGTALTFDVVTAAGVYLGGFISPGVGMRFRALHDYTAALPLCAAEEGSGPTVGRTTHEAVTHGVMNSVQFEVEGHIARLREEFGDLCVIFTGGDAECFAKRIKSAIFADRNPVFCGLDRILEYNASEEIVD